MVRIKVRKTIKLRLYLLVAVILLVVINILFYIFRIIDNTSQYIPIKDYTGGGPREHLEIKARLRDSEGNIDQKIKKAAKEAFQNW